jgi:hypothetical protein
MTDEEQRLRSKLASEIDEAVAGVLPERLSPLLRLLKHPGVCSVASGLSVGMLCWFAGAFDLPWTSPVARAEEVNKQVNGLRGEVQDLGEQVAALAADSNEVFLSSLGTRIQSLQQWACKLSDASLREEAERLQRLYVARTKTRYPDTRCPEPEKEPR